MKIVYITAGAGQMVCGSCLRDGALAAALSRAGHEVLFVPTYTPLKIEADAGAVEDLFFGGVNVYLRQRYSFFRLAPRWFERWLDSPRLLNLAARFGHMTRAQDLAQLTISVLEGEDGRQRRELERLIEWLAARRPPDVILLPTSLFAGLAGPLKRRFGCPVVSFLSGEDMFIEEFPAPWRDRTLDVLRRRVGECDGFLVTNQYYADFMSDYLGLPADAIARVPLGIDLTHFPEPRARVAEPFTIGFLARICPHKGLSLLAEAFILLHRRSGGAPRRLEVAGYLAPEHRAYFDGVVRRLASVGLSDHFEYVGEPDAPGKAAFLSSLSAFCVPCEYPEPKGRFVPEALAAGAPVALPAVGCLPEWVHETGGGLLCDPGDPESLALALERLAADPGEAGRFAAAGARSVRERFSIERMAEETVAALQDVAASRRTKPRSTPRREETATP